MAADWVAGVAGWIAGVEDGAAGTGYRPALLIGGLLVFGLVFAMNSALHSYLIVAYSDADKIALNVGFYYMANAIGRFGGTFLSGLLYQLAGLPGALWASAGLLALAVLFTLPLRSRVTKRRCHRRTEKLRMIKAANDTGLLWHSGRAGEFARRRDCGGGPPGCVLHRLGERPRHVA